MKVYKKKVKKHDEVWAKDENNEYEWYGAFDCRVKVCTGNSNYGRLYVLPSEEGGFFLTDKDTETAFVLFKEIWADNVDNHPFSEQF